MNNRKINLNERLATETSTPMPFGAARADAAAYLCSEIESPPQDDLSTV